MGTVLRCIQSGLIGLLLVGVSATACAESCHIFGGCEGRVGLIRINKGDHGSVNNGRPVFGDSPLRFGSRQLFGTDVLPASGTVLTLKRSARLRYQVRPEDDRMLKKGTLVCSVIMCEDEDSGTDYLAAGTVVRLVSYQMHDHLFALVEVIKTESHDPHKDERKYQFDHEEII